MKVNRAAAGGAILIFLWFVFGGSSSNSFAASPFPRVANTTLRMPPALPAYGFQTANAFGDLTFTAPVAIATPPGQTNCLFVVEQGGRIAAITNLAVPNRTVFLDISDRILGGVPYDERGLLGLAFHPGYATNGYFFVFYVGLATTAVPRGTNSMHDILARYRVSSLDPFLADPESEVRLIQQYDDASNHNAGDLHFGPDGYLYVTLGDEGGGNDEYNNSQRIDKDFFSGMLRIDVDQRPGSLSPNSHPAATVNYAVPPDNPFIGATGFNGLSVDPANVRTEFWAVGLRNPWRFSFDAANGTLYCADVGQGAWEEVDIITRGGNYGWAYREGNHPGPKTGPPDFSSTSPILEYSHGGGTNQGYSITGGFVYRGSRIAQLLGKYIFADYGSGNVWSLNYDGESASEFTWLRREDGIAGFGIDPRNGDVLMANQTLNTIRRLEYTPNAGGDPMPPTLVDTGAFSDVTSLSPAPGIVPYDVNAPVWSDGAIKTRWFSVSDTNQTIGFSPDANWSFPAGTVWVKHFSMQLTNGAPASERRLETRLLVKSTNGVYGVTYRWGDSLTNATLVPAEGLDETLVLDRGGGVLQTQVWHYPSWAECKTCHTPQGGYAAGFYTAQLNREVDYGRGAINQLEALDAAGYFSPRVTGAHTLSRLAGIENESVSREFRVRSFLSANCQQCHQPGGPALGSWDARISTPTSNAGIINGPLVNSLGNTNNRVVAPGSLENSVMWTRLAYLGPDHMPPVDTTVVNQPAVALLANWITNDLHSYQTFAEWQQQQFGTTNGPESALQADPDGDGSVNYLEYLTGTSPLAASSYWSMNLYRTNRVPSVSFLQVANRGFEVQATTNLSSPSSWVPLNVPANAPFFSITNLPALVADVETNNISRFYRVRVFSP